MVCQFTLFGFFGIFQGFDFIPAFFDIFIGFQIFFVEHMRVTANEFLLQGENHLTDIKLLLFFI